MTDDNKEPLRMPGPMGGPEGKGIAPAQMRVFRIPAPDPNDPRAICAWCGYRIEEVDSHLVPTPQGLVLMTFRCKNCQVFMGFQIVPPDWVMEQSKIDLAGGKINKVLADMQERRTS